MAPKITRICKFGPFIAKKNRLTHFPTIYYIQRDLRHNEKKWAILPFKAIFLCISTSLLEFIEAFDTPLTLHYPLCQYSPQPPLKSFFFNEEFPLRASRRPPVVTITYLHLIRQLASQCKWTITCNENICNSTSKGSL